MIKFAPLVPLFPLLGALTAAIGGKWLKGLSHWPIVVGIALAFCVSLGLYVAADGSAEGNLPVVTVYEWIRCGDLTVPVEFRVDGLTTMMLTMVTFVATFVAIYAAGYMSGDPSYPRFFALFGLFVFSMTGLVLSNNYILTYAFWEGVGVCSYLLVGFWHEKPAAAAAAKKAFMVNRLGDFGFAVAIFWMWKSFGHSVSYDKVLNPHILDNVTYSTKFGIAMLLFWAATAKSAQIPLYVWLPDAMEGPTPVSALIHAATMVTAGVYLIARSSLLVVGLPGVQILIASIGCLTALLAALIALTQTDLKRVMAYSTVSQLGYMFMALGAGVGGAAKLAITAGMFHLFTHAFFKALLFLASGSVMHAMGGVIDMRRFRGLRHRLPFTCWTFAVGGLALSGLPPLAAFFSKDEILAALKLASQQPKEVGGGWIYGLIFWVAVITAGLTAFYTGRAFFLTFFGPEKLPSPDDPEAEADESHAPSTNETHTAHGDSHDLVGHSHGEHENHLGHESPPIMWIPLVVLATCAILVGMIFGEWTGIFEHHLMRTPHFESLKSPEGGYHTPISIPITGTIAGILGLGIAWLMYAAPSAIPARIARITGPAYRWSLHKFYIDEMYNALVILPTRGFAIFCRFLDTYVVDGLVRLVAWVPRFVGQGVLGPLQNGLIQYYAAVTAVSVAGLLLILLVL